MSWKRFSIPFEHNVRWGGTYVIQPRHMGGFYKMLIGNLCMALSLK